MVGESANLRQEADAAKQAFMTLSQKLNGMEGDLDRASDDHKSLVEGQIEALKASIANAATEVNRTTAEYSSAVAQERNEEFMAEVKEQEELIQKEEKEAEEKEKLEKEQQALAKTEAPNEDLIFLSEAFGTASGDKIDFSNSNAGAEKAAIKKADNTDNKEDPAQKAAGGASSSSA